MQYPDSSDSGQTHLAIESIWNPYPAVSNKCPNVSCICNREDILGALADAQCSVSHSPERHGDNLAWWPPPPPPEKRQQLSNRSKGAFGPNQYDNGARLHKNAVIFSIGLSLVAAVRGCLSTAILPNSILNIEPGWSFSATILPAMLGPFQERG